jgi:ATP-dependent Clp protease, protease subunit
MSGFSLSGFIGEDGATPDDLARYLDANSTEAIITVNSAGGSAFDGAAMLAHLHAHGNATCRVVGVAASAASLVVMGANRIIMHPSAHIMIHNPATVVFGDAEALTHEADVMDKLARTYARAYASATGHPVERVSAWMDAETWLTADEALALHFCDEIEGEGTRGKAVAAFDYGRFRAAPQALVRLANKNGWASGLPAK